MNWKWARILLANKLVGFHIYEEIHKARTQGLATSFEGKFFDANKELVAEGSLKEMNLAGPTLTPTEDEWYKVEYYVKVKNVRN